MNYTDFKLVKKLGSGAFGNVYLARNKLDNDKEVAIKCYKKNVNTNNLEDALELSLQLKHPNLIISYTFFYDRIHRPDSKEAYRNHLNDINLFSILEYIPGISLYRMVRILKTQDMEDKMNIYLPQIIEGLEYLHNLKIYHGDIKHENIIVYEDKVKIIDYDFLTTNTKCPKIGTPYFLSPEIYLEKELTGKADIWALGVTVYFCLTSLYPFNAENKKELKEKVLAQTEPNYTFLSNKYQKIVKKMLFYDYIYRISLEDLKLLI